ncbi:ABC transporter ATP-binding protein [Anaeromicropila populeti]|uniref:ABC-2 type transport system ATP-binding protein n=1 Tax=Anaeromicropila populeti TaxID=37658 RepID=A0A1I6JRM9_9FIRM|nr:ABC transporter ATP-binding protein [Anaeromicropila populeti]SFR81627.1 ABC-2 type transport system ATP-binding protein [Anaeromicropila populeti]
MKEYVLKTMNVSKSFRNFWALKDVSITLEAGKIYGLIGQNGAGKTTLMKMIAGLSFPTAGTIELFGHSNQKERQSALKRIGCLIEYPGVEGKLSASENLKVHRIMRGIPNKELDQELLELVGLKGVGKKKVKDFSLGMKQRLGIAIALLGNPEFLILDEPINGLDPLGVVEIRKLIKRMCEEKNMTILISSHNLPELFQTATDYIIIDKGEIKKTLTQEELEDSCQHYIRIECREPEKLAEVLESKLKTVNYKVMQDKSIQLYEYLEEKEYVAKTIFENGIIPTHFSVRGDTLENYFISVIGGEQND